MGYPVITRISSPRNHGYMPNMFVTRPLSKLSWIPRAKGDELNGTEEIRPRIADLYSKIMSIEIKGTSPEFNVALLLKNSLKERDLDKAWEYYLKNHQNLNNISAKLEKTGFVNPFSDRTGEIEVLSKDFRLNNDHFERTIDIVRTLLRKRTSLPKYSEITSEYLHKKSSIIFDKMSSKVLQKIQYDDSMIRSGGLQKPEDILHSYYAQCFEISCLFAAVAVRSGLKAGIVFVTGHAYNWVEIDGEKYKLDMTNGYQYFKSAALSKLMTGNVPFPKLVNQPASAKEIFFNYHYAKSFMLMIQGRFDEAEKMIRLACGIDPKNVTIQAKIELLARDILEANKFDDEKVSLYIEGSARLSEHEKNSIKELEAKNFSVKRYIHSMRELLSSIDIEGLNIPEIEK